MQFLTIIIYNSVLIWSVFYQRSLLAIYLSILLIYYLFSKRTEGKNKMSLGRKMIAGSYTSPVFNLIMAFNKLRVDKADEFLKLYNKKNPDKKLTYTYLCIKALTEGTFSDGKVNRKKCFGQFIPLNHIDICTIINIDYTNAYLFVLRNAEKYGLVGLRENLRHEFIKIKKGKNEDVNREFKTFGLFSAPALFLLIKVAMFLVNQLDITIEPAKLFKDHFGTLLFSNVSGFSLENFVTYPVNIGGMGAGLLFNSPKKRGVVNDKGEIEIGTIIQSNFGFKRSLYTVEEVDSFLRKFVDVFDNPSNYL